MHALPDRPRLTVRVGITGHRAGGLPAADLQQLRTRVREALVALRDAAAGVLAREGHDYAPAAPAMTLVSSLASGSDSLVADEARALGYALHAPLPFAREEYRADFAAAADRAEFERLLGDAAAVLELDGCREDSDAAYERASAVMLEQADVLLAIWDGVRPSLVGGTSHTVRQAVTLGIPVIWIDAAAPHAVRSIGPEMTVGEADGIRAIATAAVESQFPHIDTSDPLRDAYFVEPVSGDGGVGVFRWFRALLEAGDDGHHVPVPAPDVNGAAHGTLAAAPAALRAEHDRADALAQQYATRYRDAFVGNYLMGAMAVVAALVGFVSPVGTVTELLLIAGILLVTHRGRRGQWHERWLGYRLQAEQLRHLALLRPLGRALPTVRVPAHAPESDPSRLWTSWLARARTRELGLASGRITSGALAAYRGELQAMLAGQVAYHAQSAHRNHVLAHRIHLLGTSLFYLTLVVCVAHLALEIWHHSHVPAGPPAPVTGPDAFSMNGALTFLAAVLPAFGAAFAGIASQGEFERVSHRSRAMGQQLAALLPRLAGAGTSSDACAAVAVQGVEIMTAELLDWQTTFRAKPIVLPA